MSEQAEEVTQYAPGGVTAPDQIRIHLALTDQAGNVLFEHRCQPRGFLSELRALVWRRVKARTEPLRCAFFENDNPGSTLIYQCQEPLSDGPVFFYVTVPGGAVQVPCCAFHRLALTRREELFDD